MNWTGKLYVNDKDVMRIMERFTVALKHLSKEELIKVLLTEKEAPNIDVFKFAAHKKKSKISLLINGVNMCPNKNHVTDLGRSSIFGKTQGFATQFVSFSKFTLVMKFRLRF